MSPLQVRHQISSIMATVLSVDINYGDKGQNMGNGYPGISDLLEFITPKFLNKLGKKYGFIGGKCYFVTILFETGN